MLSVRNVSKHYGPNPALSDISFDIQPGQIVGLLGENGAGKSTLLNIITGCIAPSSGSVAISGHDILRSPEDAKRCLGYLPEAAPLSDEMTVSEFLAFICELREVNRKDIPSHIDEICSLTGLNEVKGRIIGHLSKGMRQRVGIAQALCSSPPLIILDEPTIGLDPAQNADFRRMIRSFSASRTVLISSHILSEIQDICDRVLIIRQGHLIYDSSAPGERGAYRLQALIRGGSDRLIPAIRKLKSVLSVEKLFGTEPGVTGVIIEADPSSDPESELFSLLSSMDAPILRLNEPKETLESLFLRLTAQPYTDKDQPL